MSDLSHLFKLSSGVTITWNTLKHTKPWGFFSPCTTWLLLAHVASFAPIIQWPAAKKPKHLLRAPKTEPDPQSTSEFQMYTGASFLSEYIIQAFYKLVERKGNVFLFVWLRAWDFSKAFPIGLALFPTKNAEFYNALSRSTELEDSFKSFEWLLP